MYADSGAQGTLKRHKTPVGRCINHGGKNIGKAGIEIGKKSHVCDCPVRKTAKGEEYATGEKTHKKIAKNIATKVQAAFGAQTQICGADQEKWKVAIPQITSHYYGWYVTYNIAVLPAGTSIIMGDGETEYTAFEYEVIYVVSKCKAHPLFIEDSDTEKYVGLDSYQDKWQVASDMLSMGKGAARQHCNFIPRTFSHHFDCSKQKSDWELYLKDNIYCDSGMF